MFKLKFFFSSDDYNTVPSFEKIGESKNGKDTILSKNMVIYP